MKDDNQVWDCLKMSQPPFLAKTIFDKYSIKKISLLIIFRQKIHVCNSIIFILMMLSLLEWATYGVGKKNFETKDRLWPV